MITNNRRKLEKFKEKSSFRIAMEMAAAFLSITILLNLPSSVYCNINNKSVEEIGDVVLSKASTQQADAQQKEIATTTEEYENNIKLQRIQTPEGPEHRFLELDQRSLEMEHRSLDELEPKQMFVPRVEYNSWQPVGRGDPLKNDPTYDYSPPVVEPVRYWAENNKNENAGNALTNKKELPINKDKNEILILGVPAKRQNYRKESKYINHESSLSSSAASSELYKNRYVQENDNHQTTKLQGTIRRSYSYGHYHNLPTRLMPPPMQTIAPQPTMTLSNKLMPTTESYHHTYHHHYSGMPSTKMTYTGNNGNNIVKPNIINNGGYFQYSSSAPGSNNNPPPSVWIYNNMPFDTRNAESINYVSITKPEANGIIQSAPPASSILNLKQPHFKRKPWIHELLSKEITKSPPLMEGANYVSPQPSKNPSSPPPPPPPSPLPQSPPPLYIQQQQPMNTMKPMQVTKGFVPILTTQEPIKTTTLLLLSSTTPSKPSTTISTTSEPITIKTSPTYIHATYPSTKTTTKLFSTTKYVTLKPKPKPTHYVMTKKFHKITTPANELTTDALFSHYKQPEKPLFGPLYLIIEGHSKVKNYGLKDNDTKTLHQPAKIVPIEVPVGEAIVKKHVVLKDENGEAIEIKHLHNKISEKKDLNKSKTLQNNRIENESESMSLLSFLDSSLGGLFGNDEKTVASEKHPSNATTELKSNQNDNENFPASPTIFVTTMKPPKTPTTPITRTTVLEPIKAALIQEPKETRQIFDYDQFDKPSIFDFFNTGEEYSDYEEAHRDTNDDEHLNEREILSSEILEESNNRDTELNTSEIRIGS